MVFKGKGHQTKPHLIDLINGYMYLKFKTITEPFTVFLMGRQMLNDDRSWQTDTVRTNERTDVNNE